MGLGNDYRVLQANITARHLEDELLDGCGLEVYTHQFWVFQKQRGKRIADCRVFETPKSLPLLYHVPNQAVFQCRERDGRFGRRLWWLHKSDDLRGIRGIRRFDLPNIQSG